MNARERLLRALADDELCMCGGPACPTPEALVDAFAHELADSIRAWAEEDGGAPEYGSIENVLEAADLIDPEKQR